MPKTNAKSKRGDAERATVHYCHNVLGCVVTRRAVRAKFQSVDFFAADVVGKMPDGSHVYVQTTAGQYSAVTSRRRKLEKIPWHYSDKVLICQLIQTEDPANSRRKLWFFRIHSLNQRGLKSNEWETLPDAYAIPKEWFKAYKSEIITKADLNGSETEDTARADGVRE